MAAARGFSAHIQCADCVVTCHIHATTGVDWDTVDWASAPAINDVPITSAVTEPGPEGEVYAVDGEVTGETLRCDLLE